MGKVLTRSELISELRGAMRKYCSEDCVDAAQIIIDTMTDALVAGERIEIRGFGSFGLKYRTARVGRNPQDGSVVDVRSRYAVFFKAGKDLREKVDQNRDREIDVLEFLAEELRQGGTVAAEKPYEDEEDFEGSPRAPGGSLYW